MRTIEDLQKPEQIRALEMLKECLPRFDSLQMKQLDTNDMFSTNYIAFFSKLVRLPHGEHWLWNQSNAKVNVKFNNYVVLMQKMNTRRRKNGPKAPFYKLWLYSIKAEDEEFSTQFIWCEKGESDTNNTRTKITPKEKICSPTLSSTSQSPTYFNPYENQQAIFASSPVVHPTPVITTIPQQTTCTTKHNEIDLLDVDVDSILWPSFLYSDYNSCVELYGNDEQVLW